jgi:hypothetical protein
MINLTKHDGSIYRFTGETRIDNSKYGLDNWRKLELSEVSDIDWSDLDPVSGEIEEADLCIISVLSGGDYSNSCAVEYANYLEWQEMFADTLSVDWFTVSGGYGSYGIAIRVNTENADILEMIGSLADYCVINDERVSLVEMEWQDYSYRDYVARDFIDGIETQFEIELQIDDPGQDDLVFDLFQRCADLANEYWEVEQHGSAYIRIEKLVNMVEYADLLPFLEYAEV